MNKIFATVAALGQAYVLFPVAAKAAVTDVQEGLTGASETLDKSVGELSTASDLPALIGNIINVLLGALGIIFLVLIVYAGYLYLIDQGSGEKVKVAKKIFSTSIIGLALIIAAYAIANYVLGALTVIAT